ncbi:MAG TPA: efflux RND transporter periplasmic adaptor subunit [Gemmatimonadales bacterium]|nr:efflux RND transporter periplasmic adaptor subunit [Gemmatimonadales bacterium]
MSEIAAADTIVADLADFPCAVDLDRLRGLVDRCELWLVVEDTAVYSEFLKLLAHPPVQIVTCATAERTEGYSRLAKALTARLRGSPTQELADLVLAKEPLLRALKPLVRAVCTEPRDIRRPRDLARACGLPLVALKKRVAEFGFSRVEQFIVCIRLIAYEQAVAQHRLHANIARRLVGIRDPSNFRRQLGRARRGSPEALRRLKSVAAALLLLVLQLSGVACRDEASGQADAPEAAAATPAADTAIAIPVVAEIVRRGDLVLSVRSTGQVRARRQVNLKVEAQGTVAAVLVRPGDRVDSGQVLVQLDPRPFDLAVREAQAAYDDALVRLRDILIGEDTTDASPAAVERRRNARLRAGLDGAQARLERAQLERERATIRAPFAGTADQVLVVAGQHVAAGDPIATVVDLGSLVVEAAVLEHDLPLIRRGATAVVSLGATSGRSYSGRVFAVLPLIDTTTRSGRALVRVRTGDGVLRPGMYADIELEAIRLPDRVLVPATAVIERDGRPLVFRYHRGRAEWVYVTPGRSNGRETEIVRDSVTGRPAVAPGDTVLVQGHLTLTHDAPVRLLGDDSVQRRR